MSRGSYCAGPGRLFQEIGQSIDGLPGQSWRLLDALLAARCPPEAPEEAPKGHPGAIMGPLGAILGPSWALSGPSWAILGPSWAIERVRGRAARPLGGVPGGLGRASGAVQDRSWGVMGPRRPPGQSPSPPSERKNEDVLGVLAISEEDQRAHNNI